MDGNGSATITDLTVELVANRERYEEIYPSESDSSETDEDHAGLDAKSEHARNFTEELQRIRGLINDVREDRDSAQRCLGMLANYGDSIASSITSAAKDIHESMEAYRRARKDAFEIKTANERKLESLEDDLAKFLQDNRKIAKDVERQHKAVEKAKHNRSMKKRLANEARVRAKNQLREERSQFWPRKVYQVVLTLDTNLELSRRSSRRASIGSLVKSAVQSGSPASPTTTTPGSPLLQHNGQISLSLSYSTHAASWSPRYDLSLSTPGRSGTITYRAEFSNQTSESWRDTKVILSTSQTTFQNLSEPIPILPPWQIRLSKLGTSNNGDEALVSRHELASKHKGGASAVQNSKESRHALFGLHGAQPVNQDFQIPQQLQNQYQYPLLAQQRAHQQAQLMQQQQQAQQQQQQQMQQMQPHLVYSTQAPQIQLRAMSKPDEIGFESGKLPLGSQHRDLDAETIKPDDLAMNFEESAWEETGLTATYDVPGLRTIPPSNTTRRHQIASVVLQDVRLSYILVPKLREAAFLQARLRNSSSITLLRGPAGLTLDGSFLGTIMLPRCSAGQPFSLNLGVDPAVRVGYQKPTVHHRQSGIFQKEGSGVYTRAVTVTNTKNNAVVEGVVLDQVPVSEDERLRVEICQPKGLKVEGDRVACGAVWEGTVGGDGFGATKAVVGKRSQESTTRAVRDEQSGKSTAVTAVLRKGGEVCWEFKLGMGKAMRLVLEYETRYPSSEKVA